MTILTAGKGLPIINIQGHIKNKMTKLIHPEYQKKVFQLQ